MLADYFNILENDNRWIKSIIKSFNSITFTIKGDNDDNLNQNEYIAIDKITNEIKIKKLFDNNFEDFYLQNVPILNENLNKQVYNFK